jgi:hypothetical protein
VAYLGAASIVINQATLPPGVAGRSRDDGVTAQLVTLSNADNTNISSGTGGWTWTLYKPRGSTATLSSPTSPTCTFTPDIDGTYRVELKVNEGLKSTQKAKAALGVRSVGGYRVPAQGETTEANWTSSHTGNPNETGWWEDLADILRSVQGAFDGSLLTVNAEAALAQSRQIAFDPAVFAVVDNGGGSTLDVTLAINPGTERHDDTPGFAENIVSTRQYDASTHDAVRYGQVNLGSQSFPGYGTTANYATIAGGLNNLASGQGATVGGGVTNTASATNAVVSGGTSNTASAAAATVGGGNSNTATAANAGVLSGSSNDATGAQAAIAGGSNNAASGINSGVLSGSACSASADRAGVVAGTTNIASGDDSFVGAGDTNNADGGSSAVVAGTDNEAQSTYSIVGAGELNIAAATHSGILAGASNQTSGDNSGILAGSSNTTGAANASVCGGVDNSAGGIDSHVGGGNSNSASGLDSVVAGGNTNIASGDYSSSPGGRSNTASASDAHAWGRQANATHAGSIVIKDGSASSASSSAANEITLYGSGNIRHVTNGARVQYRLGTSSNNYGERVQGHISTTDATVQNINIAAIPNGGDCTVRGTLKGKRSGTANSLSYAFWATYTNNGGAVAMVGAPHWDDLQTAEAWNAAVDFAGTDIRLEFNGAIGTTIRWSWDFEVHYGGQT